MQQSQAVDVSFFSNKDSLTVVTFVPWLRCRSEEQVVLSLLAKP